MKKINIVEKDFGMQCKDLKIGVVLSTYHNPITSKLESGCVEKLLQYVDQTNIEIVCVPGAVEIPIALQKMAKTSRFDALVALGAVIRRETAHFDYVCEQANLGCQRVMLDYHLPVAFGVLTVDSQEQALARVGGNRGHVGVDAAVAALQMALTLRQI